MCGCLASPTWLADIRAHLGGQVGYRWLRLQRLAIDKHPHPVPRRQETELLRDVFGTWTHDSNSTEDAGDRASAIASTLLTGCKILIRVHFESVTSARVIGPRADESNPVLPLTLICLTRS